MSASLTDAERDARDVADREFVRRVPMMSERRGGLHVWYRGPNAMLLFVNLIRQRENLPPLEWPP